MRSVRRFKTLGANALNGRATLLWRDDAIYHVDPQNMSTDRVTRIPYEQIAQLWIQRRAEVALIVGFIFLAVLPGCVFLALGITSGDAVGLSLASIWFLLAVIGLIGSIHRRVHVLIFDLADGTRKFYPVSASPRRFHQALVELLETVRMRQAEAHASEPVPDAPSPDAPVPDAPLPSSTVPPAYMPPPPPVSP